MIIGGDIPTCGSYYQTIITIILFIWRERRCKDRYKGNDGQALIFAFIMKQKPFLLPILKIVRKAWAVGILLTVLLPACTPEPQPAETVQLPEPSPQSSGPSIATQYFSDAEMQALHTIKAEFEKGLRVGKEKRTVGYAYTQHANRMRLDFFDEAPINNSHPFNGAFTLSMVQTSVEQLPFVTRKCGFEVKEVEKTINYYCLSLDENYFNYLDELGATSALIKEFATVYKTNKTVTPAIRKGMVMESLEQLDMDNWDHQLFYLLFQCWTNEELMAYQKVKALQKEGER